MSTVLDRISAAPWKLSKPGMKTVTVVDAYGFAVAETFLWSRGTGEANAQLMAAAPNMLKALKYACENCTRSVDEWGSTHCHENCPVAMAIREAEGIKQ